ncbi:MAG: AraC family transcriptional regulator [Roseovarius sp.]
MKNVPSHPSHPGPRLSPPKVLASAANGAAELFARRGGDVDRIFGCAGIALDDVASPVNELSLASYCRLFTEAARQTGDDGIGLAFGRHFKPRQLGALGYAAISSPTLAAALRNMIRFFPAHQEQTQFGLLQDSGLLWLTYHIYDPRIADRRQDAELSLGMFVNIFRAALGPDWCPLEVRFAHDRPADGHAHESCFGAPVQFNRRTNAIAFARRDLDAPMPDADPYLFSVITPFLERRCAELGDPEDFARVVREQIKLQLGETPPTLHEIAHALGVTDKDFQRRLKAHGVAFPDLLRAARQELALHYMADRDMPLTEIAYSLGYSELSAFSRAFRNWTGMTPQRYRRTTLVARRHRRPPPA